MTRADMPEAINNAELGEDSAANHDVLDQGGIDAWNRGGRSLGRRRRHSAQQCDQYRPEAREPTAFT